MREDPDYNQRQYERMLQRIDLYRQGQISLPKLISDLQGLISALENVSQEWRDTLLGAWAPLEHIYAIALDQEKSALDDEDCRIISEALNDLERILKTRGPESNSLVN